MVVRGRNIVEHDYAALVLQHAFVGRGAKEPIGPLQVGLVGGNGATNVLGKSVEKSAKAVGAAIGMVADDGRLVVGPAPGEIPRYEVDGAGLITRQADLRRAQRKVAAHVGVLAHRSRRLARVAIDGARRLGFFDDVRGAAVPGHIGKERRRSIAGYH